MTITTAQAWQDLREEDRPEGMGRVVLSGIDDWMMSYRIIPEPVARIVITYAYEEALLRDACKHTISLYEHVWLAWEPKAKEFVTILPSGDPDRLTAAYAAYMSMKGE